MARCRVLARAALLAAVLILSLARPGAAQPCLDERWGPVPPPGKGLRPVETPLCRPRQQGPCEFAFGPDRRLRVPTELLHPAGVGLARGYGMEWRGDEFVRHFPYGYESGPLRLTWGGLRAAVAALNGARSEPAHGDEATLQITFRSRRSGTLATLDQALDCGLGNEAPDQVEAVRLARERGGDAALAFTNRHGREVELVFRGGRLAAERRCAKGFESRWPGTCRIKVQPDDVHVEFWFGREVEPRTEEAAALVLALLDSFVVEGPKFIAGDSGR